MPDTSAPSKPSSAFTPDENLLAEAALILASFRWKLQKAGYPFREPDGVPRILARIDARLFPDERKRKSA